jgi:hypothetical protein
VSEPDTSNQPVVRESEFSFGSGLRRDLGTVDLVFRETGQHNLEDAQSLLRALGDLGIPEEPSPLYIDVRATVTGPSKEARGLYRGTVLRDYATCIAILTNSLVQRMIGRFLMMIDRPVVPFEMFENEGEARAWISKQSKR